MLQILTAQPNTETCCKYSQHNQIQKRVANAIQTNTEMCCKYAQNNRIQKHTTNMHNASKYRNALQNNALQVAQTTTEPLQKLTMVPFQSVTPSHVGWPTKLVSRQRDQSTSSVTKRVNGHWHAIIASSCRWSQREYKRQQVHRINSSFRFGAERWCITTALYFGVAEITRVRASRQQQRWSRSRGYQVRADDHTRSVRWPAPLRASALKEQISLKEQHGWSRLFKDVLSPVRFWVWSVSVASGRSQSLPHVSGHSARWGGFRGWFMFFLWGHDHLGVA